jgi:chorismate--pyruvate lyase
VRRHWQLPARLRSWLLDDRSLTAKLQQLSGGDFRVEVLRQRVARPALSERRSLGLGLRQLALVREVVLYGRGQPWVFARSILPLSSLTGSLRRLRRLDNRPLGAFLFSQPGLHRGAIEVAALSRHHRYLPRRLCTGEPLWGRRSVFFLQGKPLLVSEVFLEPLVSHITQLHHPNVTKPR